jgi:cation transporter-like permease
MMSDQNSSMPYQPPVKQPNPAIQNLLGNGLVVLGLAGLVGGVIGAVLSEVIQGGGESRFFSDSLQI